MKRADEERERMARPQSSALYMLLMLQPLSKACKHSVYGLNYLFTRKRSSPFSK